MIKYSSVPMSRVSQFAKTDAAYIDENIDLKPFYKYSPTIEGLLIALSDRRSVELNRVVLRTEITRQYDGISTSALVSDNIALLDRNNTFTITTAHQPILAGGPLYVLYKILNVINLCRQLKASSPNDNFVPVYVIGGEDHDFEEINHFDSGTKKAIWAIDSHGPVGRLATDSLQEVLKEIEEIVGSNEISRDLLQHLATAYRPGRTYNEATLEWINFLFGRFGLVVVQMDNLAFKRQFEASMKRELLEQISSTIVADSQSKLLSLGYKSQAYVRDINLFLMDDHSRNRISLQDGSYEIVGTEQTYSEAEIRAMLEQEPNRFSPNVVMRPLLQETILPNLAYVGGGGEIAYWLERKTQFEAFGIPFPVLIRRNSAVYIGSTTEKKLQKTGFENEDLLNGFDALVKRYLHSHATNPDGLLEEKQKLASIFEAIANKAGSVDSTLQKSALAELAKSIQGIEHLEQKITRALKQKHEVALKQLEQIFAKTFPNDSLQERTDYFLTLLSQLGTNVLDDLLEIMDPLKKEFLFYTEV
ncbi:MAG: bacillithiol biosynthesis cysteine-adding enzyme BshC [Saprospiraceae bacterium]